MKSLDWNKFGRMIAGRLNFAIGLFAVACLVLTRETKVIGYAAIAEIWYMVFILLLVIIIGIECNPQGKIAAFQKWITCGEWQSLFSWLLLLAAFVYFFIIRSVTIIVVKGHPIESPFIRWEIVALVWNLVFSVLSYFKLPLLEEHSTQISVPLLCIGNIVCASFALKFLVEGGDNLHLCCVLLVAVFYLLTDIIIAWKCIEDRLRCKRMFLYADLPTLVAIAALWAFWSQNSKSTNMGVFLSGAIAFQFITCSVILAVIEGRESPSKPVGSSAHGNEQDGRAMSPEAAHATAGAS